ncbi:MAG: hypothetical protein IKP86_00335, partial [Anaerolineaceae bacterium]|nr:hypothetical protein [Anaerolineaceae bacterium]
MTIKELFPSGLVVRSLSNKVDSNSPSNFQTYQAQLNHFLDAEKTYLLMKDIPNLSKFHEEFRENGTAYILTEYVEGKSLKQLLRE